MLYVPTSNAVCLRCVAAFVALRVVSAAWRVSAVAAPSLLDVKHVQDYPNVNCAYNVRIRNLSS